MFCLKWTLSISHISSFVFDAILLWEINSHKTNLSSFEESCTSHCIVQKLKLLTCSNFFRILCSYMNPFNSVLTKSVYHVTGTLSETQQSAKQNHNESEQLKSKCCTSSVLFVHFWNVSVFQFITCMMHKIYLFWVFSTKMYAKDKTLSEMRYFENRQPKMLKIGIY
jgi:hypothetical protein